MKSLFLAFSVAMATGAELSTYLAENPAARVKTFSFLKEGEWTRLEVKTADNESLRVWIAGDYSERKNVARYITQRGNSEAIEFRNKSQGGAALPSIGGWSHLFPDNLEKPRLLGHAYRFEKRESVEWELPNARIVQLAPDILVGVPSNTRQKDERRRYDGSEYEYVRLTKADYREMAAAGINCVRVDREQLPWIEDLDVFYWGLAPQDLPFPDSLYDPLYLGASIFLDEPAVTTRDSIIRPRLAKDSQFRKDITPQIVFDAFREHFEHVQKNYASAFVKNLAAKHNIGDMQFTQENIYSWETMVSTAAYQLTRDDLIPNAVVFEPPGRVGTRRTLPEINMTYGCQIPVDNPKNFIEIIYGFTRGAARVSGKQWGTSIYGAVDRADAPWFLTHAYDLGATRFFFWDNAQLACVPYSECLSLARTLKMRAIDNPRRDLARLREAAEVCILLPVGYDLGHVAMGKGSMWGLGELNLERTNRFGVKYRTVMGNFFTEIERAQRLGVAFDLFWELPGLTIHDYREIIRVREDGKVEVTTKNGTLNFDTTRKPARPDGSSPRLRVDMNTSGKAPADVFAHATVPEGSAPVFYTYGADLNGAYQNAMVAWEIYGPNEEDYRHLQPAGLKPRVITTGKTSEVAVNFRLERPGNYRLRAATVDMAGRTTVIWMPITVTAAE